MTSPISRRVFLAGAALALAGCSRAATTPSPQASEDTSSPTGAPSPIPSATMTTETPGVDVDAVIAAHTGRAPTAWGVDLPGIITRGREDALTLTFDACGGEGGSRIDRDLIDLLRRLRIKATLFLNQRWVKANTSYARELAADDLFEIGNHGTRHCPLSVTGRAAYGIAGTASVAEAAHEVYDNHAYLADVLGRAPRLFRAGTAHYDDVGLACCQALGETPVGFAINGDAGATYTADQVVAEAGAAVPGQIVISHMNQPAGQTYEGYARLLPTLLDRGVTFAHLP